jgi:predicted nucleotidyltransferase
MYLEPLTKTSVEILVFLSSRIRERFTVRQIAEGIGRDYKITYIMTMRLAGQRYVIAEKKRPVTYCRLNVKDNQALLAYIESIRANRFFENHKDIEIIVNDINSKITLPFFTLMLFGSHVKGTASAGSDLDMLLIIPERKFEKEVASAVGSVQRVSPVGIHEVILTESEFRELLKQKTPNVAWEAIDNRIVPYGAEALFKMLGEAL